jgi:ribosomal protein S18 acetylase RimI-like enzyme
MTLLPATEADLHWLLPLAKQIFRDAFEAHYQPAQFWGYVDRAYTEPGWQAELRDPLSRVLAAWQQDQPVGYLKLAWNPAQVSAPVPSRNVMEIARLYLDFAHHGSGIAQQMMDYAVDLAQAQGRDGLWLGVWQDNHRAKAFYHKNGFHVVGTHPFEMGDGLVEDDLVMYRALT